ncbi:MAG: hypothetical protein WDZ30_07020 [Cellvibrionaceae bacterium]
MGVHAGPREDAKWLHDRIAGVPPNETDLNAMQLLIEGGDIEGAAEIAMDNEAFYSATLKRMAAPWTNRDLNPFVALNDYIATFIGIVRDETDFREILYGDIVYTFNSPDVSAYSISSNDHYEEAEQLGLEMGIGSDLEPQVQSVVTGFDPNAVAGLMTTRASAEAFFYLGTNRAMLRFTLMAHLCRDLEQMEDTSGVPDRIRQDISRSPGGDSRLFTNGCVGCHAGMDPLTQAFAYHDWDVGSGRMTYNTAPVFNEELEIQTRVTPKHHINAANFPHGYVILNDRWDNYWRDGVNANLGWDAGLPGSGNGIASMGRELANSRAFAQCQVEKVFKTVCLRRPEPDEVGDVDTMTNSFITGGYNLKQVFAETAAHCLNN